MIVSVRIIQYFLQKYSLLSNKNLMNVISLSKNLFQYLMNSWVNIWRLRRCPWNSSRRYWLRNLLCSWHYWKRIWSGTSWGRVTFWWMWWSSQWKFDSTWMISTVMFSTTAVNSSWLYSYGCYCLFSYRLGLDTALLDFACLQA